MVLSTSQPVFFPGDDADLIPPRPDQPSHHQPECEDDLQGSLRAGVDGGEGDGCLLADGEDSHVGDGREKREEDEDEDALRHHPSNLSQSPSSPWFMCWFLFLRF